MIRAMVPLRIRVAAVLLSLFGAALFAYTVIMSVPLVLKPDPMFGVEMIVSALLLAAAGGAVGTSVGLSRSAAWARPIAIGVSLLLILVAGARLTLPD